MTRRQAARFVGATFTVAGLAIVAVLWWQWGTAFDAADTTAVSPHAPATVGEPSRLPLAAAGTAFALLLVGPLILAYGLTARRHPR